jgi:hypothetical protein
MSKKAFGNNHIKVLRIRTIEPEISAETHGFIFANVRKFSIELTDERMDV